MNVATPAPLTRDQILLEWKKSRDALNTAKADELDKRIAALRAFFPNVIPDQKEGTENFPLGNDWKLKATFKFNYNLDNRDKVNAALDALAATGEDGKFIAGRIVNWKPELSIREYRALSDTHKKIVDGVLTIKPALPSLEIVEPK